MIRFQLRSLPTSLVLGLLAFLARGAGGGESATVRFDFETGGLQGWRVVEGKFGKPVCEPRDVRNHQGGLLLTTLQRKRERNKSDRMTGVAESPVFVLEGPDITLRVGGGKHRSTYVALCTLDGKEHVHARGRNSVVMQEIAWHVPKLVGRQVFLRVVDKHEGAWGHVTLDDVRAVGRIDPEATAKHFAARAAARREAARRKAEEEAAAVFRPLRLAVTDLSDTFGTRYPKGKEFLARLDALVARFRAAGHTQSAALAKELETLRREALIANPLVSGQPIVFVVRRQYRSDHHNTATMFQTGEINTGSFQGGGSVKTIDFARGGKVATLVSLPKGVARDIEVSFDGKRVLFSMRRNIKDDYHLYEIGADGAGLKQLTFGRGATDFDPLYLPSGQIAFSSTREPKYCMCNRHIMGNLFRMDADGANIAQIGRSTLHEGHGALMPDGRILYDRWEYVDRNFGDAQGLWTCNPDGTNHNIYFGNHTRSPGAHLDARVIPGTGQFIATFSSCHDRPWGAIAICDRRRGVDGKSPVLRTWPATAINLVEVGNYDTYKRVRPKYEDPWPLAEPATNRGAGRYFLAARQVRRDQMGIVLIDTFGNEVLLHAEPPGCFDPMPLAPRPKPVTIPDRIRLDRATGAFYVYDVYTGFGMDKVERGAVKYLRVVESPEKRFWTRTAWNGSGTQAPGMAWDDFNNKRILGTVPVEPDGSAYFEVPADRFVYFQLLDEKGMMVQSMRSGTIVRPGELTGCIGCHENRLMAMPNSDKAAIRRPPSRLVPWHGKPRLYSYLAEVQPVFDRHCVRCHDFGKKGSKKLTLAGDLTLSFNVSYMELRRKKLVRVPGAGPAAPSRPYQYGSHASKLAALLLKGHNDVKLSAEELDRIITWIDINAPYYPDYASAYPNNLHGRSPLDGRQLARLGKLTGRNLGRQSHVPQITFTRPELSPCLARFKNKSDPRYQQALAIIQAGKQMLAKRPRADMPGFQYLGIEAKRQAKYAQLAEAEAAARQAIRQGHKRYANGQPPSK